MATLQRYLHRVHKINLPACPLPSFVFETTEIIPIPFVIGDRSNISFPFESLL